MADSKSHKTGLHKLEGAQLAAADPERQVWLSASAGTGKTQVLTARVFRLLLTGGVEPENILCLTYTKAGATEMANRVNNQLANWVRMKGTDLARDLIAIGAAPTPEMIATGRKLFAKLLDAPGAGLQIMTIHSFCQRLLASFPAEAGLIPGFQPMEERDQAELMRQALAELTLRAEAEGNERILEALAALSYRRGEGGVETFLKLCCKHPVAMKMIPEMRADGRRFVLGLLGLNFIEGSVEEWLAQQCQDHLMPHAALMEYLDIQRDWGTSTAVKRIAAISEWLPLDTNARLAGLDAAKSAWQTGKGTPPQSQGKQKERGIELAQMLIDWSDMLLKVRGMAAYADLLTEALYAGKHYNKLYEDMKQAQGLVDFDDLVRKAAQLLKKPGIGDWIVYKLDAGIDHILVDESQDSNKAQWDIVDALADEYFAGLGRKGDKLRTLFTVGDFKQAIYGFQGTSPQSYKDARERFSTKADQAQQPFAKLEILRNFRSTAPILRVVDGVLDHIGDEPFGADGPVPEHQAFHGDAGRVMLLPPFVGEDEAGEYDEEDQEDLVWISPRQRQYADWMACNIRAMIDNPPWLSTQKRHLHAADIMLLLTKRGELASLLVARLSARGVPVAGVDRLKLGEPLATLDLMAAVRFVLQPEDDLNLAALLVSPLFGWSQQTLLDCSDRKKGISLWQHIRHLPEAKDAATTLRDLLARADIGTPYQFLEHMVSGPMAGRRKLAERLGHEINDPVNELLSAAQNFSLRHPPSLQSFCDWMDRGDIEIKREGQSSSGLVRVMTVHGSKGLQAPCVILADMAKNPFGRTGDDIELDIGENEMGEAAKLPMLHANKDTRAYRLEEAYDRVQKSAMEEHRRLLYVAMTRAEDLLIMAGDKPKKPRDNLPEGCWYNDVEPAMQVLAGEMQEDPLWGPAYVFAGADTQPTAQPAEQAMVAQLPVMPSWMTTPAPKEARPPRPLSPSDTGEDDSGQRPSDAAMMKAARRGSLLHALFERLPDVPLDRRETAALGWLAKQAADFSDDERRAIWADAASLIGAPEWAHIFSADSLAEVPIAAVIGEITVAGKVDRLLIGDDVITAVDFKTGRFIPHSHESVPRAHVRQMAWYRAALQKIYPGRKVEAALLYSSGPKLIRLSEAQLALHSPAQALPV